MLAELNTPLLTKVLPLKLTLSNRNFFIISIFELSLKAGSMHDTVFEIAIRPEESYEA